MGKHGLHMTSWLGARRITACAPWHTASPRLAVLGRLSGLLSAAHRRVVPHRCVPTRRSGWNRSLREAALYVRLYVALRDFGERARELTSDSARAAARGRWSAGSVSAQHRFLCLCPASFPLSLPSIVSCLCPASRLESVSWPWALPDIAAVASASTLLY